MILMYHYIGRAPAGEERHAGLYVPEEEFRGQLAALASGGYRALSPDEYGAKLAAGTLGSNDVWITFDDGRLDNFTAAMPMLLEAKLRATFFIIADRTLGGHEGYLHAGMMREMRAAGMDIGSHTLSHPHLARIPAEQLRREVADSKARLEDALGEAVPSFCYPYGNWNAAVVEEVKAAGYALATSTIRDNRNAEADRWLLKRVMIQPGRTGLRFRYALSPFYHWLHARKNLRRWEA